MHTRIVVAVAVLAVSLLVPSSPALGQTYVSGSLVGDIARFSHTDIFGVDGRNGGGEAVGFGLRVGTHVGTAWGVELEFVRPSVIESAIGAEILPALPGVIFPDLPLFPGLFPPVRNAVRTETRNTTVGATIWAKQQLSGRLSLVYSGGVAMVRSEQTSSLDISPFAGSIGLLPVLPSLPTGLSLLPVYEAVSYSLQPVVGGEARIGLTERVQLVPGVRLYGLEGGWVLRPSVGVGWTF
jgi:hypothetical protein